MHTARRWRIVGLAVVGILFMGFVATAFVIGRQVDGVVLHAQSLVNGEPVEALLTVARSEQFSFAERNRAIWALGQLGATEALPVLESLVTSKECDHDSAVCQHEVAKAVNLCSGSFNAGAIVWRHGRLAVQ